MNEKEKKNVKKALTVIGVAGVAVLAYRLGRKVGPEVTKIDISDLEDRNIKEKIFENHFGRFDFWQETDENLGLVETNLHRLGFIGDEFASHFEIPYDSECVVTIETSR